MATRRKVKHVVADSGAFIRNAPLRDIGKQIYTLPDVVAEIKDKATKQRLQFLPYQLEYREPTPEAVQIVTEFSKKTGDYPSLSATDIQVLALAYQLEKEYVGTEHIKTTPNTKIEINLSTPTPSEPTQIAGFYLGTQNSANRRTTSESVDSETSDSVDNVTSALERHTLTDRQSEVKDKENTKKQDITKTLTPKHSHEKQIGATFDPKSSEGQTADVTDMPEVISSVQDLQISELSKQRGWLASQPKAEQKIYSEVRDDSTGGHVNLLTDEEEFPSLSRDSQVKDIDTSVPCQVYVEVRDNSDDSQANNLLTDKEDFPVLSTCSPNKDVPRAWGVPKVHIEVKDESGIEDSQLGDESEYPALSTTEFPSLLQGQSSGIDIQNQWTNRTASSGPLFSYAKITREGETKVQVPPAVKKIYHEGQVLPSNIIGEEEEEGESEDESEEEIDEGIAEEDDGEGWITPSNIKEVKKQMGLVDTEQADVVVGCLTTDFAMQNVLIQMGLNVISVDGMLIKKAKSYVLRCFACFKLTSKMDKLFCPHCGNHTLKRIAMTVNDDGTIKYFFSRRKQLTARGLRQSLPTPKGGKYAHNPLLVADQPLPHQRPSRKALQSMDVFDPDFTASESPFSKHDVTSRAAQLGIMRRGQGRGHRHQAGGKKNGGKRK